MPRQFSSPQVYHQIRQRFEVVAPALLFQTMRIKARKTNRTQKVIFLAFFDVDAGFRVDVKCGKSKIDQTYFLDLISRQVLVSYQFSFRFAPTLSLSYNRP